MTLGHFRVTISYFRVNLGHLKDAEGHFRVTIGHYRITIGQYFLYLSKHQANTTEVHPKVKKNIYFLIVDFSKYIIICKTNEE